MIASELLTKLNFLLSDLADNADISSDQRDAACTHALQVTGLSYPVTNATGIEALVNRAHHFALMCLRNDWLQKYDIASRDPRTQLLARGSVWKHINDTLNDLQSVWDLLLSPALNASNTVIINRTAHRA
jgi:hypothetical protein